MNKLIAFSAVIVTSIVLATAPAGAESTANTGSVGPADEPALVFPLVAAFVVICLVGAFVTSRHDTDAPR